MAVAVLVVMVTEEVPVAVMAVMAVMLRVAHTIQHVATEVAPADVMPTQGLTLGTVQTVETVELVLPVPLAL